MTEETQPATLVENMLLLRREDFDDLLDRAAERGAERCLAHLGLENGHAAKDIRELRDLLEAWRDARRTAWQTAVKVITEKGVVYLMGIATQQESDRAAAAASGVNGVVKVVKVFEIVGNAAIGNHPPPGAVPTSTPPVSSGHTSP